WPFDKFVYARRTLGTQMQATGEVMSIAPTFEQALMKAVRGAEIGLSSLRDAHLAELSDEEIFGMLHRCDDRRLFVIFEAMMRGVSVEQIHDITRIDNWFLYKIQNLCDMEKRLAQGNVDEETYLEAKKMGYPDAVITKLSGEEIRHPRLPVYHMVDTCAAEFAARTPYFYATYDDLDEAKPMLEARNSGKKTVMVLGSGPIRIGQGIEFDYASVHCVWALQQAGYEVVIVNNNPETVSTDFDTADRLYFEPLTLEDVLGIIEVEKPEGVVVAFGGQTAIRLAAGLQAHGIRLLGTNADSMDRAEDRQRFDELLSEFNIRRPQGFTVMTCEEALEVAHRIGYPVLLRPSYVLGGQNMIIAFNDNDVEEYMAIILSQGIENPILIDQYLMGTELEVDAICDGEDILIPGVMEHIERAGVHSGDSIAVYPAYNVGEAMTQKIIDCTRKLSVALDVRGLINIQYLIFHGELYVIEVNLRSSRTVPYISKVTGIPMVDLASRAMLGQKLKDMGYGTGLHPAGAYVAVKVPVFSFEKLANVDTQLGPEMKSTGEVLGIAATFEEALYKGLVAAGYQMKKKGGVLITVRDTDKVEIGELAKKFSDMGFWLYATRGTAKILHAAGISATVVSKIHESADNVLTLMESGRVDYVISTSAKGRIPTRDSVRIRRKAVEHNIPCLTSLDTAGALADSLRSRYSQGSIELVDIKHLRTHREMLRFIKMEGCGNDYIYFDCFNQDIVNPEGLSVRLSDRHFGIGGDGVVLICPSNVADAKMRMFNLDGSEGMMCGNAIRCVAKYLYDAGRVANETMTIETLSGIKTVTVYKINGQVTSARVDMGAAELTPARIPVALDGERIIDREVTVEGETFRITCVSMGNPHCVLFVDSVERAEVERIGTLLEMNKALFPQRVNVEFVQVIDEKTIKMRVWERGSGETWACGTGACAATVAAVETGRCTPGGEILVKLVGGNLKVEYTPDTVFMTGKAVKVFEGAVEV
nr:carbamoyl-phosphate synthase large subunit [bacterium]